MQTSHKADKNLYKTSHRGSVSINDFNGNLKKMSDLESETEVLRREIENALYTQTIKRVIGMSDKPLANE